MQSQQQSPNQITQVLAQSPAVQELLTRDPSYVQSYSEFCKFRSKKPQHFGTGQRVEPPSFRIINTALSLN